MKFHIHIPHEKIFDPYFSCLSYAPFWSYVPMKTKFENFVCKISQKVLELESSYLVYWQHSHLPSAEGFLPLKIAMYP